MVSGPRNVQHGFKEINSLRNDRRELNNRFGDISIISTILQQKFGVDRKKEAKQSEPLEVEKAEKFQQNFTSTEPNKLEALTDAGTAIYPRRIFYPSSVNCLRVLTITYHYLLAYCYNFWTLEEITAPYSSEIWAIRANY